MLDHREEGEKAKEKSYFLFRVMGPLFNFFKLDEKYFSVTRILDRKKKVKEAARERASDRHQGYLPLSSSSRKLCIYGEEKNLFITKVDVRSGRLQSCSSARTSYLPSSFSS